VFFCFYYRFPDETENMQSASSGVSRLVSTTNYSLIEIGHLILELAVNLTFRFRRRRLGFVSFFRKLSKNNEKIPANPVDPV